MFTLFHHVQQQQKQPTFIPAPVNIIRQDAKWNFAFENTAEYCFVDSAHPKTIGLWVHHHLAEP